MELKQIEFYLRVKTINGNFIFWYNEYINKRRKNKWVEESSIG
jgi:hypothetical protein